MKHHCMILFVCGLKSKEKIFYNKSLEVGGRNSKLDEQNDGNIT